MQGLSKMGVPGDFISAIVRCADRAAVGKAVKNELDRFGYSSSACTAFQPHLDGLRSEYLFRNWSAEWIKYSTENKLSRKSFTLAEARRRTAPFTWGDITRQRALSCDEQEALDAAKDFGWKDGIVVPIHGPNGYLGFFGMATHEPDVDVGSEINQRLAMVGYLAHQRCLALATAAYMDPIARISPRELECLRWVATGKTDREIGSILSLSPHTVKMHVDSARLRLGASTRAQAAAHLAISGRL